MSRQPGHPSDETGSNSPRQRSAVRELLSRAWNGDRTALRALFDHLLRLPHWTPPELRSHARELADTIDSAQQTLAGAFRPFARPTRPPQHRHLASWLRETIGQQVRLDPDSARPAGVAVEDNAAASEAFRLYRRSLGRLEDPDKELIVGRVELGFSYEQLALALEYTSTDACRQALREALLRLAEEMTPE